MSQDRLSTLLPEQVCMKGDSKRVDIDVLLFFGSFHGEKKYWIWKQRLHLAQRTAIKIFILLCKRVLKNTTSVYVETRKKLCKYLTCIQLFSRIVFMVRWNKVPHQRWKQQLHSILSNRNKKKKSCSFCSTSENRKSGVNRSKNETKKRKFGRLNSHVTNG